MKLFKRDLLRSVKRGELPHLTGANTPELRNFVPMPPTKPAKEAVNHPSHYNTGNIEVIDAIDEWQLGFSLGNAVKYIARAGRKDPTKYVEDLKKAMFYIQHEIDRKTKGRRV